MRNEVIGITSVFVLVLVLFILGRFILTIGRENEKRSVAPAAPPATDESKRMKFNRLTDKPAAPVILILFTLILFTRTIEAQQLDTTGPRDDHVSLATGSTLPENA